MYVHWNQSMLQQKNQTIATTSSVLCFVFVIGVGANLSNIFKLYNLQLYLDLYKFSKKCLET